MRVALGIEYDGGPFRGWQRQGHDSLTVQETLEGALSSIAAHPVTVLCAGRTDTGVHALGQVVHFDTDASRLQDAWVMGTNTRLPPSIGVRWAQNVCEDFHARYRAKARRYCFVIHNHRARPTLASGRVTWQYRPLDAGRMAEAAGALVGTHDFSSFRASECQAKTPVKTVSTLQVERVGDLVVIHAKADAFLHHMVRNIAGALMAVGTGVRPVDWMHELLLARDRRLAPPTAGPGGLYLMAVDYPDEFGIPGENRRYPILVGGLNGAGENLWHHPGNGCSGSGIGGG